MKCYFCGGKTEFRRVTDLYAEESLYLVVEKVPAEVCRQCGERYYSRDVTKRLLAMSQKAQEHVTLSLPGQRAGVTICRWQENGGREAVRVDDLWEKLALSLEQKPLIYSLERRHEFRVEEKRDRYLIIVPSTGVRRPISRHEIERAWDALTKEGSITLKEIARTGSFNASYVVALLAQLPGVKHQLNPVTLLYSKR